MENENPSSGGFRLSISEGSICKESGCMTNKIYQLRAGDGLALISAQDLAFLGLDAGESIGEAQLRRRIEQLPDRSLREAIHAMLDQEEPGVIALVQRYPPSATP